LLTSAEHLAQNHYAVSSFILVYKISGVPHFAQVPPPESYCYHKHHEQAPLLYFPLIAVILKKAPGFMYDLVRSLYNQISLSYLLPFLYE